MRKDLEPMLASSSAITTVKCFGETGLGQDLGASAGKGIHQEQPMVGYVPRTIRGLGLRKEQVEIIGQTRGWLRYPHPPHDPPSCKTVVHRSRNNAGFYCVYCHYHDVNLQATTKPEFDYWEWVDYWQPHIR